MNMIYQVSTTKTLNLLERFTFTQDYKCPKSLKKASTTSNTIKINLFTTCRRIIDLTKFL